MISRENNFGRSNETGVPPADKATRRVLLTILLSDTLAAKFALPGSDGSLSIRLALAFLIIGYGVAAGRLVIHAKHLFRFSLVSAILVATILIGHRYESSIPAILLVLTLLFPYVLEVRQSSFPLEVVYRQFNTIALFLSILGVAQFVSQLVVGKEIAFFLDYNLPEGIAYKGYNNLNALGWGVDIYKANGVFLPEPSALNQLLCLAILIEMIYFRRIPYLLAYCAGVIVTYSGTGLIMLAVVAPFLVTRIRAQYVMALVCASLLLVPFAEQLRLNIFVERVGEFSSEKSSAYARFFSMFRVLSDYVWSDPMSTIFGRGPGSVAEHFANVGYAAFAPTWGKLLYEYGLFGFVAYAWFITLVIIEAEIDFRIKLALSFLFWFLGGLLATPDAHLLIYALVAWPASEYRSGVQPALGGAPQNWRRSDRQEVGRPI